MPNRRVRIRDEDQFSDDEDNLAFTFASDLSRQMNTYKIKRLKQNNPDFKLLSLGRECESFTEKAWEKLGFYIAGNQHLDCISLRRCNLNDVSISLLFKSVSMNRNQAKALTLFCHSFGPDGMRSLMPFFRKGHYLTSLNISENNIETEGLWWLMKGLDGGSIEKLNLRSCALSNISVIEKCFLPHLNVLYLSDNNIGVEGCEVIATLLMNKWGRLKKLFLNRCNSKDEGSKMLCRALKKNVTLTHLHLESNNINHQGLLALLRLVYDISSIDETYNSNHTLKLINLHGNSESIEAQQCTKWIEFALKINQSTSSTGKAKVVKSYLSSKNLMELSDIQGVSEYYMRPFVSIDSKCLPYIIALVGQESGLSDMYYIYKFFDMLSSCSDLIHTYRLHKEENIAAFKHI